MWDASKKSCYTECQIPRSGTVQVAKAVVPGCFSFVLVFERQLQRVWQTVKAETGTAMGETSSGLTGTPNPRACELPQLQSAGMTQSIQERSKAASEAQIAPTHLSVYQVKSKNPPCVVTQSISHVGISIGEQAEKLVRSEMYAGSQHGRPVSRGRYPMPVGRMTLR